MSTQVNILPQLTVGPSARTVIALLPKGPRFVGFNSDQARLKDQTGFGRHLNLGHLELLHGLAGTGAESDAELIGSIQREYGIKQEQLNGIARIFRNALPEDDSASDAWRPPIPTEAAESTDAVIADQLSPDRLLAARVPLLFRVGKSGFEHICHHGTVDLCLTARELSALRHLTSPATIAEVTQTIGESDEHLAPDQVNSLLERLLAARVLRSFQPDDPDFEVIYNEDAKQQRKQERVTQALYQAIKKAEDSNPAKPGAVPVFPVNVDWAIVPLALGYLFSAARKHKGGRLVESFDFRPNWLTDESAFVPAGPMVRLHSHYIWNSARMLACAAQAKAANPLALNIHGGPDVPKYEPDVERYFSDHPYVDIAVHGEGEVTICEILDTLSAALLTGEPVDLALLNGVAGLSYRGADGRPVRTADRPRIENLDDIPSPYLTGEFDVFAEANVPNAIMETNRGCPYGCTFCDWGSATASKIRRFDLDRVFAELEWCARSKVQVIGLADANFGTFSRDVEIAQRTADLKKVHGFPLQLGTNYAKNSVKHLKPIVETLAEGDILAKGLLSLQSMDEDTLSVINRANIKLKKYEALAAEFRANNLPLYVDLMMGLPGSTIKSFRNDLQECVDREVYPKIHPTQLLVK